MLVTIISAEHSLRSKWVREYFASKGDEVKVILVDKSSVHSFFARIDFSKQLRKSLDALSPDLIYCDVTIDFLMRELKVYKNKNNNVKLIFDVCDDFNVDQKYLNQVDHIFCASESCRGHVHGAQVLYPTNGQSCLNTSPELSKEELFFCLIGNKNIDMNFCVSFLRECSILKKCTLHILGDWKLKESFIQSVLSVGVNVVDHKELDSQSTRQEVYDQCHYGLNLMDFEGINSESLEYMCGQIPIINSIEGDLSQFCKLWDIGKNINKHNFKQVVSIICAEDVNAQLNRREHMRNLYKTYFTKDKFFETLDELGGSL